MSPYCANCDKEMMIEKTGATVAPAAHTQDHQYSGDLYRCENCNARVIVGFSLPYHTTKSPNFSPYHKTRT